MIIKKMNEEPSKEDTYIYGEYIYRLHSSEKRYHLRIARSLLVDFFFSIELSRVTFNIFDCIKML